MNHESFLDIVKEFHYKRDNVTMEDFLEVIWDTEGETGGSCWDSTTKPIVPEVEPEFSEFDEMLLKICPSINFLKYKMLLKSVVKYDTRTTTGWYGNWRTQSIKTIVFQDLFDALAELELI